MTLGLLTMSSLTTRTRNLDLPIDHATHDAAIERRMNTETLTQSGTTRPPLRFTQALTTIMNLISANPMPVRIPQNFSVFPVWGRGRGSRGGQYTHKRNNSFIRAHHGR